DHCQSWMNLTGKNIRKKIPGAIVCHLTSPRGRTLLPAR
ncbi:MAG: hypothetical protein ACI8XO_004127, partial [Verrucomicrobiales bacterium]